MNKKLLQGNFQNKSDLIRRVYEKHPTATNRQIKRIVQQLYGIEVNSNLVVGAIGKYKNRIVLAPGASNILSHAKQFLRVCLNDLEQAIHFLKKARAA